jgi:hypothetical protein
MALLEEFFGELESFYVEGKPRHVSSPNKSLFKRLAAEDEETIAPQEYRGSFSKKFFVVRKGSGKANPEFNERQLRKLLPLDKLMSFHDYSIEEDPEDPAYREVEGSFRQVLDEHRKGDEGKILNVLDIKRDGAIEDHPLFTDVEAYRETKNCRLPFGQFPFPVHDHAWWLVATKDACHGWHVDPAGLCTYIEVVVGLKLWAIAVPPPGSKKDPIAFFGDLTQFFKKWEQDKVNGERWRIEAVLLRPGDKL